MSFAKCAIYLTNIYVVRKEESLPTWERGLKLPHLISKITICMSLPTWERGLKHHGVGCYVSELYVAPHVGAWIETFYRNRKHNKNVVAPHVGAWIETTKRYYDIQGTPCRSPRGSVD